MNAPMDLVERFRYAHHNIAMMFAMGMTVREISRKFGITTRRLNILLSDPTFNELIAHYREQHTERAQEALTTAMEDMEYLRAASIRKLVEMYEESDETGEPIPANVLLKVHDAMADRTGYSKHTSKSINIDVNFATALERASQRSNQVRLIEGEILPTERRSAQLTVMETPSRTYRRA